MKHLFLVGLGGAIGAVARWKISAGILHHAADWRFPIGTFVVNVVGCAIAGILAGLVTKREMFSSDVRLLLFTGLLGGFTTFSAFGVETVYLLRRAEYGVAFSYIVLSVAAGIGGLWLALVIIPGKAPG
jgi:CrcB protein